METGYYFGGWIMETITKYKSVDGVEFMDQDKCAQHEARIIQLESIMSELPYNIDDSNFINGMGFIQHDDSVLVVRDKVLVLAQKYTTTELKKGSAGMSYAGRVINDACPMFIWKAWNRFMCLDDKLREWGQPYYAMNPEKAEQRRLN